MAPRKRNLKKRVTALSANAQAWLRGDKSCGVFFLGKHQDELQALWTQYGDHESMQWTRGMRLPITREA